MLTPCTGGERIVQSECTVPRLKMEYESLASISVGETPASTGGKNAVGVLES